jgi:hypothetical protein
VLTQRKLLFNQTLYHMETAKRETPLGSPVAYRNVFGAFADSLDYWRALAFKLLIQISQWLISPNETAASWRETLHKRQRQTSRQDQ